MEGSSNDSKDCVIVPPHHHQAYPWLVLHDNGENKTRQKVFYSVVDDCCYNLSSVVELQNQYVTTCSNKKMLVIIDSSASHCFLLDILTMNKLSLSPMVDDIKEYPMCVTSSSLMDGKDRVVFFSKTQHPGTFLSCSLGDTEFVKREVTMTINDYLIEAAVNFEGKLYVWTTNYCLMMADFSDPDLVFNPVIRATTKDLYDLLPKDHEIKIYLVESCGDLLLMYTRRRDRVLSDIKILKADIVNGEWVVVESLGDRAIFLDARNGFSSRATENGLRSNCVYYVNKRGGNLFVYDLEDESISMSLPHPTISFTSSLHWMSLNTKDSRGM